MRGIFGFAIVAGTVLLAGACSSGRPAGNRPPAARTPGQAMHQDLSRVPTVTPAPDVSGVAGAETAAVSALRAFPPGAGGSLQILIPQPFSAASAIDVLRLSIDTGAPHDSVPPLLARLGWQWLLAQDALDGAGGYRQWRVMVLAFASAAGAVQYLASPLLLPAALAKRFPGEAAAEPVAGARLLRAADAIVPLSDPAAGSAGERAALLWRRGRIVFQVVEAALPAPADAALLAALARELDRHAAAIPGASEP